MISKEWKRLRNAVVKDVTYSAPATPTSHQLLPNHYNFRKDRGQGQHVVALFAIKVGYHQPLVSGTLCYLFFLCMCVFPLSLLLQLIKVITMDAMFMWRCAILVKSDVFVLIIHQNKSFDLHIFLFLLFTIFAFPICLFPQFKWYDIKLENGIS
jgi:hypothetical protein